MTRLSASEWPCAYSSSNPMYAIIRSMRAAIGREFAKPLRRSSARKHSSARQHLARLLGLADRLSGEGAAGAERVLRPVPPCRLGRLAAGAVAGMLLAGPALADPAPAAAITACDRLAAVPDDPNREGPGVAL